MTVGDDDGSVVGRGGVGALVLSRHAPRAFAPRAGTVLAFVLLGLVGALGAPRPVRDRLDDDVPDQRRVRGVGPTLDDVHVQETAPLVVDVSAPLVGGSPARGRLREIEGD